MGTQQDHSDSKSPAKGDGSKQANQKGQGSKSGHQAGRAQDQVQQRSGDSGGDYNTGTDQERARDSGEKSHQ